jgi:mRNA-degrading endonuclease RelE of RelBE toxin-antitoxin system
VSGYKVHVTPAAWKEIKNLPGRMRQRVRKAVDAFADDPRPAKSKALDLPDLTCEVRRLRLDRWRIVYDVTEEDETVDVLAVRKRPPYDYGDLESLLKHYPTA